LTSRSIVEGAHTRRENEEEEDDDERKKKKKHKYPRQRERERTVYVLARFWVCEREKREGMIR
jgi:hypothetical protein